MATEQELREYLRKATLLLQEARQELKEHKELQREPIAIVAAACRLPARIETPDSLWDLITRGDHGIEMPPAHRGWDAEALYDADPESAGKTYCLRAGYLQDADAFDASFFDLTPREAEHLDPQQRLLLEVSWEAIESAGIPASKLSGSSTGVFVGVMDNAYAALSGSDALDRSVSLGSSAAVASSRIAYALGLRGPAISSDSACSSSLVSIHLACQALRLGECDLALAGGATVLTSPGLFVEMSRERGLAPDGRCKPFSAQADGVGWAEGAGILVLERLSDARRSGRPILGIIRGSAVNSDGRGQGLTAPNGSAQQEVIERALRAAGLNARDVDAVEAHGTGTRIGDSIEAQSILATYGRDRQGEPLWLGNMKPYVGHTQAAAGVMGVMKVLLSIKHASLPGMPNVGAPSELVDWSQGNVRLLDHARAWPRTERPRRAAVSAFGVGTNAHVIVEEPPHGELPAKTSDAEDSTEDSVVLLISAKTENALRAQAERLARHLETEADTLGDVAFTLSQHRTHFRIRAAVHTSRRDEAIAALRTISDAPIRGVDREQPRPIFVFPHEEHTNWDFARALYETEPEFARAFDACDSEFVAAGIASPKTTLLAATDRQTQVRAEPSVIAARKLAVAVALAAAWRAWGVLPWAVAGEGDGSLAAAVVSERLTIQEAARVLVSGKPCDAAPLPNDLDAHSVVLVMGRNPINAEDGHIVVRSIATKSVGRAVLLRAASELHVHGVTVDWSAGVRSRGKFIPLPTYAFQRSRYWAKIPSPARGDAPRAEDPRVAAERLFLALSNKNQDERLQLIIELVRDEAAAVLNIPDPREFDDTRTLFQLGLDSLRATELRKRLQTRTGTRLPATLIFENPQIEPLAVCLLELTMASLTRDASTSSQTHSPSQSGPAPAPAPAATKYEEFDI